MKAHKADAIRPETIHAVQIVTIEGSRLHSIGSDAPPSEAKANPAIRPRRGSLLSMQAAEEALDQ